MKSLTRYRGTLTPLSPSVNNAADGQQLCLSSNGNYYIRINGFNDVVMIPAENAANWMALRGMPIPAEIAMWVRVSPSDLAEAKG